MKLQTLDMRFIRYLNLFNRITKVRTKDCFFYNNMIIFAVPSNFVSRAIGESGKNVKRLSEVMKKRVKIVKSPNSIAEAEEFVSSIVFPTQFKSLEISQDDIIIRGSMQSKAALIGRNRVRFKELEIIIRQFFGKNLKIV